MFVFLFFYFFFFFQAEDGIRDLTVTGVQTCALPISDRARVRDVELLWLEDLLPRLARRYDPHVLECQSPGHRGERRVETTYYPKRGEKFYCPACREEFTRQREAAAPGAGPTSTPAYAGNGGESGASEPVTYAPPDTALVGVVKHKRL